MKYRPKEISKNVNISKVSPIKEFCLLLSSVFGIVILVYIILGFVADSVAPKIFPKIENSLGKIYLKGFDPGGNKKSISKVQNLLNDLLFEFPEKERDYKVYIVPNSQVNAFALPGKNIILFSALLKEANSENELSFILAHELGHFASKDHLRGFGRMIVLVAISTALLGVDSGITDFLINALVNVEMKFSQQQEKKADLWAINILNKKYGHVAGAIDFFEKMGGKEGQNPLLHYFSTHPHPQERVKALKNEINRKGYLLKEKKLSVK